MLKRIPASAKRTIYSFLAMDSEVTSAVKPPHSLEPVEDVWRRSIRRDWGEFLRKYISTIWIELSLPVTLSVTS